MNKKSFICPLWQKEWAKEEEAASVLTVTAMILKGSIIAARAYRHDGGREDRKSTIIMEGEGDLKKTDDLKTQNKSRQTVKVEEL